MSYKKGELVRLSDFGKLISGDKRSLFGIVMSEPYNLLTPLDSEETIYYEAYDLLVDEEVIKGIPVDFLNRMTEDEKNAKRVEEVVNGD